MNRDYLWHARVSELINKIECAMPPGEDPLPPGEDPEKLLLAMHAFKYDILAAFARAYVSVPPKLADAWIMGFLTQVNAIVPSEK